MISKPDLHSCRVGGMHVPACTHTLPNMRMRACTTAYAHTHTHEPNMAYAILAQAAPPQFLTHPLLPELLRR